MTAERWLLQTTHFHIITGNSGVGRMAAFAALRHGNAYTIDIKRNVPIGEGLEWDLQWGSRCWCAWPWQRIHKTNTAA